MESNDKTLAPHLTKANLQTKLARSAVDGRKSKPSYSADQAKQKRPERLGYDQLVLEAFGSTVNWENFVLLKYDINSVKEKIWSQKNPMAEDKYSDAWKHALEGGLPSNEYLSIIKVVRGSLLGL